MGPYNQTKFERDPSSDFFSPYTRNIHPMFACLPIFFGPSNRLPPTRQRRLLRLICQMTWFRARKWRKCPF